MAKDQTSSSFLSVDVLDINGKVVEDATVPLKAAGARRKAVAVGYDKNTRLYVADASIRRVALRTLRA